MIKDVLIFIIMNMCLAGCSGNTVGSWEGKTANFIGDSITSHGIYVEVVKDELNLGKVNNFGIARAALCKRYNELDKYTPLVDRWDNIPSADLHFILIGTNDYSTSVPLGDENSTDVGEFYGCLNTVFKGLKEKHPNELIVVSTILKRRDQGLAIPVEEYNEAIIKKVEEYEFVLFDGYNLENLDLGNDFQGLITTDRLHPNEKGARILGEGIADFLKKGSFIIK